MLNRFKTFGVLGMLLSGMGVAAGCDNPFAECRKGFNCPGDGDGVGPNVGGTSPGGENAGGSHSGGGKSGGAGNSGGANNSGGAHTGGGAPSGGMGGEASGGAPPQPCDGACKGDTPICDEQNEECVGCLEHTDCEEATKPMCGLDKTCVACTNDFSCTDTLGLIDTPKCLDGTEDETTGEQRPDTGACAECGRSSDCGGAICDLETLTCIEDTLFKGKGLCDTCIDDRECKDGQLCAEMKYDDPADGLVGRFCLWLKDAPLPGPNGTCGINSRPYSTSMDVTSMNGVTAEVCTLATTTCPSLKQHRTDVSGCEMEFVDDDACGAEEFNDGKCRLDGNSDPKCTYTCVGAEDCAGVSCTDTGTEKYCAL